jgi:hypothetical protein
MQNLEFLSRQIARQITTPVRLPPGRLRLAARPNCTGSTPMLKTIGMVAVAALAASVAGVPAVTIPAIRRSTRSAASAGRRSFWPRAKRYSIATLWPST